MVLTPVGTSSSHIKTHVRFYLSEDIVFRDQSGKGEHSYLLANVKHWGTLVSDEQDIKNHSKKDIKLYLSWKIRLFLQQIWVQIEFLSTQCSDPMVTSSIHVIPKVLVEYTYCFHISENLTRLTRYKRLFGKENHDTEILNIFSEIWDYIPHIIFTVDRIKEACDASNIYI